VWRVEVDCDGQGNLEEAYLGRMIERSVTGVRLYHRDYLPGGCQREDMFSSLACLTQHLEDSVLQNA
jgi:hypothetical protein